MGWAIVWKRGWLHEAASVSYTHLDVYKRQGLPVAVVLSEIVSLVTAKLVGMGLSLIHI